MVTQYFVHLLSLVTDNNSSQISRRRRITAEIISMKVCDRARIKLATPGSAVRLATNCGMGPSPVHEIFVLITYAQTPSLALYVLMDSSFWFDTINSGWFIVYIERSQVINKNCFCLSKLCRP